jgi:hypothetical protein
VDVIELLEALIRIDSAKPFECRAVERPDGMEVYRSLALHFPDY